MTDIDKFIETNTDIIEKHAIVHGISPEDVIIMLKELDALAQRICEDLRTILEPHLDEIIRIMNQHQTNEKRPNPKRLTDPRFRKKKGRTVWR